MHAVIQTQHNQENQGIIVNMVFPRTFPLSGEQWPTLLMFFIKRIPKLIR